MSRTDAERQRRYRYHLRGDHEFCLPERGCEPDVTRPPARLEYRGMKLWSDLGGEKNMPPEQRVMIEEMARIADRLEKLDRVLTEEDAWLEIHPGRTEGDPMVIVVDAGLREVRQQQLALKQLSGELRAMRGGELGGGQGEVDPLDQLAQRRADRRAGTGNG
jgi:hypothetical protein